MGSASALRAAGWAAAAAAAAAATTTGIVANKATARIEHRQLTLITALC